jgi:uncharacterized protein
VHRELSLPFRLDRRGRIASTGDPNDIARQHLTSFLLTNPGERIMRPDFGTPLREGLFEPLDTVTAHVLLTRAQERVTQSVRTAVLRNLSSQLDSEQSTLRLTVEFALPVGAGEGVTRSTTITLGGGE